MPAIFKRRAVYDHAMTVGPREKNRIVRRYFIQIHARRKDRRFPESLDPTPTRDPLAGRRLPDPLFHLREKIFEAVRSFEVQIHLSRADAENVTVRIGHPRHHGVSLQIDPAAAGRGVKLRGVCIRADEDNSAAFYRDRFRMGLSVVYRVDVAVDKNGLSRFGVQSARRGTANCDQRRDRS